MKKYQRGYYIGYHVNSEWVGWVGICYINSISMFKPNDLSYKGVVLYHFRALSLEL